MYPDWPFKDEFYPALFASYQNALMAGNLTLEASIKDILIQANVTPDDLTRLQWEIIAQMGFVIFYYQSWYYRLPVCETADKERMFRVIQGNKHEPFGYDNKSKKKKKVKEKQEVDLDFWGAAKKKPTPAKAKVLQVHQHPDGFNLVNLPKSAAIHYARPGGKKTLCGKPWDHPVKDEHKLDTLYPVCEKCRIKV